MSKARLAGLAVLALVAANLSWLPLASAQNVNNFSITSFEADYYLGRTQDRASTAQVIERIEVQFPNYDQNHGILRAIPKSYQDHTVSLEVSSVKNGQGQPWTYTSYTENDNLVLKIGDADRFVRGQQVYEISYSMRNVTTNLEDSDEFYWDINGDQWPVSFGTVTARVHLADEIASAWTGEKACYAGRFEQTSSSGCRIEERKDTSGAVVISQTNRELNPYETLTIALGFEGGTFIPGPEIAEEQRRQNILFGLSGALATLPPVLAGLFMYNRWRKFGDDPSSRGVIVPEYQPPKNIDALAADYIYKQDLRAEAISAQLIAWAVAGNINIHEIPKKGLFGKKDYELTLKTLPANLPPPSKKALELIFGSHPTIGAKQKISDFKSSRRSSLYDDFQKIAASQAERLHSLGYFVKNPRAIKTAYRVWSAAPLVLGGLLFFVGIGTSLYPLAALGGGFLLAGLVMIIFSFIMPARTQSGVYLHDYMMGLEYYIKLAQKDRLKFGQSPEGAQKIKEAGFDPANPKMRVKLFESLLPFAMLFGHEKKWAQQFEGIYKTAPDWYSGHRGAFSAAYLGSSIGEFRSASTTSFSPPTSSGSSGISGGSSGGGGGGGGGGGW